MIKVFGYRVYTRKERKKFVSYVIDLVNKRKITPSIACWLLDFTDDDYE
jgi:hypothetical protein